jgi:phosphoheptose isomerase
MNIIALIDTRPELPGETIGTVISTHGTMAAAFKANEVFQSRMRASGEKSHIRTKIVTLKERLVLTCKNKRYYRVVAVV